MPVTIANTVYFDEDVELDVEVTFDWDEAMSTPYKELQDRVHLLTIALEPFHAAGVASIGGHLALHYVDDASSLHLVQKCDRRIIHTESLKLGSKRTFHQDIFNTAACCLLMSVLACPRTMWRIRASAAAALSAPIPLC